MDENNTEEPSREEITTYYEILEVSPRSTLQEIHNQYMKVKSAYTHDNPAVYSILPAAECQEMMEKIEEAYFILSSPRKRREYDLAHGIKPNSSSLYGRDTPTIAEAEGMHERATEDQHRLNISRTNISKKIVENRFNLDYSVDEDMEHKIETTSEFSGVILKEIREYKNLSIERLADLTKISKTYLKNIEDENFETLPATVYIRGFIFQYAKILKLSQELVTDTYIKRVKQARATSI